MIRAQVSMAFERVMVRAVQSMAPATCGSVLFHAEEGRNSFELPYRKADMLLRIAAALFSGLPVAPTFASVGNAM
jgi:hypothetical protein